MGGCGSSKRVRRGAAVVLSAWLLHLVLMMLWLLLLMLRLLLLLLWLLCLGLR